MAQQDVLIQTLVGGELSRDMLGRSDLPVYQNGCRTAMNFVVKPQGGAVFRNGLRTINHTRQYKRGKIVRFQFNTSQAYCLEFTDQKMRVFRDDGVVLDSQKAFTPNAWSANTVTVTGDQTGNVSIGDEVFIDGVGGAIEINARFYTVSNVTLSGGDTILALTDVDGNLTSVDVTTHTPVFTNASVTVVYELDTPYREVDDLTRLRLVREADVAYVEHPKYETRQLTRTNHDVWTLSLYTRTADAGSDPFVDDKHTIVSFDDTASERFEVTAHGYADGDAIYFEGMNESASSFVGSLVNSLPTFVDNVTVNHFGIQDADGTAIDLSSYVSEASGVITGTVARRQAFPNALTLYESRLWYGGQAKSPQTFGGSKAPESSSSDNGEPEFDDFTLGTGSNATDAIRFTLAEDEVNSILWMAGSDRVLLIGTFGSLIRVSGETLEKAVSPTSINRRAVDRIGVLDIPPVSKSNELFYVHRGDLAIHALDFDALKDKFVPTDRTLVATHIVDSVPVRLVWQTGQPNILWVLRTDGVLAGMTSQPQEGIAAWHRHRTGPGTVGTSTVADKLVDVETVGRPNASDALYVISERVFGGVTRRFVEIQADSITPPDRDDFVTEGGTEASDTEAFERRLAEVQARSLHLDSAFTYDGSAIYDRSVTPADTSGDAVDFTASSGTSGFIFTDVFVGREIRKKAVNGFETGRAVITSVTNANVAVCRIIQEFDSVTTMAAGEWYITRKDFHGFEDYKGQTLSAVVDGRVHSSVTVSSTGAFSLETEGALVHVGVPYTGVVSPLLDEFGGQRGPAQTKNRIVSKAGVRFLDTLGAEIGTDLYNMARIPFMTIAATANQPTPLFSGVKNVSVPSRWSESPRFYIRQMLPLPCHIQAVLLMGETDER